MGEVRKLALSSLTLLLAGACLAPVASTTTSTTVVTTAEGRDITLIDCGSGKTDLDLVCETGGFAALDAPGRLRYVEAAARALRPGGLLFGAFPRRDTGALLTLLGAHFDAARLDPSAPSNGADADGWLEAVFVRR